MGTSTGYGGPASGLVPTWIDQPNPGSIPASQPALPGAMDAATPIAPRVQQADTFVGGSLGAARSSFSRFSGTGSRTALGSALSHYIRGGTGGATRAARRMGASRAAATRLLAVVRDVQQLGAAAALRTRIDIEGLAGRPAADVFMALLEVVCPPGGAVDEAIARQAMLDTIAEHAAAGVGTFDSMTSDQLNEFFLDVVARSIEGRVMADIGGRGISLPEDIPAIERAQRQLHEFVVGCTRGHLGSHLAKAERDTMAIERVVTQIYESAFDLILAAAEDAE